MTNQKIPELKKRKRPGDPVDTERDIDENSNSSDPNDWRPTDGPHPSD